MKLGRTPARPSAPHNHRRPDSPVLRNESELTSIPSRSRPRLFFRMSRSASSADFVGSPACIHIDKHHFHGSWVPYAQASEDPKVEGVPDGSSSFRLCRLIAAAQLGKGVGGRPAACVSGPGSDEARAPRDRAAQARGDQALGSTAKRQ
jgi:hypothetical protein